MKGLMNLYLKRTILEFYPEHRWNIKLYSKINDSLEQLNSVKINQLYLTRFFLIIIVLGTTYSDKTIECHRKV